MSVAKGVRNLGSIADVDFRFRERHLIVRLYILIL